MLPLRRQESCERPACFLLTPSESEAKALTTNLDRSASPHLNRVGLPMLDFMPRFCPSYTHRKLPGTGPHPSLAANTVSRAVSSTTSPPRCASSCSSPSSSSFPYSQLP